MGTSNKHTSKRNAMESIILTSMINAMEGRDVAVIDVLNSFIQMVVENEQDQVTIHQQRSIQII